MKSILLVNFDGLVYGIWESDILSIEDLPALHSLPATPSYIAGVVILHDRTVMLADLSVCIGHVPMKKTGIGHALLLSETASFAGFAVEEEIRHVSVADNSVYSMPEYLTTPVVDSCVLIHSILVPVINISGLYTRVQKGVHEPPVAQFTWPGSRGKTVRDERIRLIEISDGVFGASAAELEDSVEKPGPLSRLFAAPPFVAGIVFHNGRILPVIDLLQRLSLLERGQGETMLVAGLGDSSFGFLIHGDEGFVKNQDVSIKALPSLVQSGWIRSAVEHAGEIVPILDLEEIVRTGPGTGEGMPLAQRYTPDSGFSAKFVRNDVSVVEFSLLGQCHALPKTEVLDSFGFKPYREIPNAPEIAIGVAEYNEELLPVLDLAMVFGRRSLVTPDWHMLHVKNGDFQALVITEDVFGEREIPVNIQRDVPIVLPHNVVYGCYPDANSVRLILNVEALAVYFEKTLVQELLPAMTPEMKQAPAEIVPSLLGEPLVVVSRPVEAEKIQKEDHVSEELEGFQANEFEQVPVISDRLKVSDVAEVLQYSAEAEKSQNLDNIPERVKETHDVIAASRVGEAETDQVPTASSLQSIGEPGSSRVEAAIEEAVCEDSVLREEATTNIDPPAILKEPSVEEQNKDEIQALPVEELPRQELQEQVGAVHEESSVVEPEVFKAPDKAELISTQPSPESAQEVFRKKEVPLAAQPIIGKNADGSLAEQVPFSFEQDAHVYDANEKKETVLQQVLDDEKKSTFHILQGSKFSYGAIASVLVLLLCIGILFWQTGVGKKEKLDRPPAAAAEAAKKKIKSKTTQKKPVDSLVLEVPADASIESGTYVVNEGDTLWDISERLTGDPFKYPQIAGENRIPDPDLIFPDQKIIIKKKEK